MAAHDGEARTLRRFYKNDLDLPTKNPETHVTISMVSYFADEPSEEPVIATATPSAPAHAHRHDGTGTGLLRRPLPTPKCEPTLT